MSANMPPRSPPPRTALPSLAERKPSGIHSAAVNDRSTSVSSSLPSQPSLGGTPFFRRGHAAARQRSEWVWIGRESELRLEKTPRTFSYFMAKRPQC